MRFRIFKPVLVKSKCLNLTRLAKNLELYKTFNLIGNNWWGYTRMASTLTIYKFKEND